VEVKGKQMIVLTVENKPPLYNAKKTLVNPACGHKITFTFTPFKCSKDGCSEKVVDVDYMMAGMTYRDYMSHRIKYATEG